MEEDLDIDALQDMLEESDDDETQQQQEAGPSCQQSQDSSDDDDIDEDELDKLAALVEGQAYNTADKDATEKSTETAMAQQPSEARRKDQTKGASPTGSGDVKVKVEKDDLTVKKSPKKEEEKATDISYADKFEELKAMQEKIKVLEAQLLAKSREDDKKASPEACPDVKNVKTEKETESKVSTIRPLTEDIFGTESGSIPEPNRSRKPSNSHSEVKKVVPPKLVEPKKLNSNGQTGEPLLSNPHDSDSDWEGMDGEKPSALSKEGKEIRKMLSLGTKERVAHTAKYTSSDLEKANKKSYNSTWKSKLPTHTATSSSSGLLPLNESEARSGPRGPASTSDPDDNVIREPFSGIRIVNPLVSSHQMKSLMSGRRNIKVSKLHAKANTLDTESDWVIIGVMVSKTEAKKSAKGNKYTIWRLSDLDDCDKNINFFLFNKVYEEHWKVSVGSVIGLLNPSIMQKEENKKTDEVSITIDNPKKLLLLGRSQDLGRCRAKTKAGNDCTNPTNITRGDYCTYHVQSAYKKSSSKRSELQAGFSGVVPKSFEKQLFNKGGTVIYGGQSFSTTGHSGTSKNKNKSVSVKSLQQHHVNKSIETGKHKVSTLQIHDILPEDKEALREMKAKKEDKNEKFHEALSIPGAGSMNFVKHLKIQEKTTEKEKTKSVQVKSVSVQDFLKTHGKDIKGNFGPRKPKPAGITVPPSALSKGPSRPPTKPGIPSLGKGLRPGDEVSFDLDDFPAPKIDVNAHKAKLKAIQTVKSKGGIQKANPNASKTLKSPTQQERIKKRLAETSPDAESEKDENCSQPPKKKSRILGGVDLDDPAVQKLLNARSKHDTELAEQEIEKMDRYFDPLEKKEAMEDKMRSVTSVKCKVFTCKQCKYSYYAPKKECREQKHQITVTEGNKKFFKCKQCNERTTTLDKIPLHACKKCGANSYEKCSMLKERNGPKLPGEELLLRGEECKFLNSLQS